jgi:hypothetical protein
MAVADSPNPNPKPAAKPDGPKPASGNLARASESGDPAVQYLLAERQAAQMNREALQATDEAAVKALDEDIKAADARIDDVNKRLAELGYE